jgi:DNA-binding IclR family transcriptional regulator
MLNFIYRRVGDEPMKTIDKTVRVLDALTETNGARVAELADRLEMPNSTVHAHLAALKRHGFVRSSGDHYALGLKFLFYGGAVLYGNAEYSLLDSKVTMLAEETGERAQFITEQNGRGFYLYAETESDTAVQTDVRMGKIVDLHPTAAGKAILAHLPVERVDAIIDQCGLEAYTEHTITDRDELLAELERIREQGYSVNDEERISKQMAIGVPVLDKLGEVVGAFSVSGPAHRIRNEEHQARIISLLLGTANEVELNLVYQ